MRGIILGFWMILCASIACGQELPGLAVLPDGGFAPRGAGFRVTFRFAEMDLVARPARGEPLVMIPPGSALPANEWSSTQGGAARLDLCCVKYPIGLSDVTLGAACLRVVNPTDHPFKTTLAVAIAPQGAIYALAFDRHAFFIEGRPILVADTPSRGAILADAPFTARPLTPQDEVHVESAKGQCRGEMLFDLTLKPGQTLTLGFLCPVHLPGGKEPDLDFYRALSVEDLLARAKKDAAGH
jgi:hypothetical protein